MTSKDNIPSAPGSGEIYNIRQKQAEAGLSKPQPRQRPERKESTQTPRELVIFKCFVGKSFHLGPVVQSQMEPQAKVALAVTWLIKIL